jgi:hypothetical protein
VNTGRKAITNSRAHLLERLGRVLLEQRVGPDCVSFQFSRVTSPKKNHGRRHPKTLMLSSIITNTSATLFMTVFHYWRQLFMVSGLQTCLVSFSNFIEKKAKQPISTGPTDLGIIILAAAEKALLAKTLDRKKCCCLVYKNQNITKCQPR